VDEPLRERWRSFNPDLRERLAERLAREQEAGTLRRDLSLDSLGRFFGVVLDGLAVQQGAGFGVDVDGTLELVRSAVTPK
jgi:hypothetical protein